MNIPQVSAQHRLIYAEPHAYCAHPHIVKLVNNDWLLVFNRSQRRPQILHPPHDPLYYNLLSRSRDEGETWSTPQIVPGYHWHGVECAGLSALKDGAVLFNQWRFNWYPLQQAKRTLTGGKGLNWPADMAAELGLSQELDSAPDLEAHADSLLPWVRAGGATFVHRSDDGGLSWTHTTEAQTAPYSGGYGMRGALELSDGSLFLPLSDVPNYRQIFALRSDDGGRSWSAPQAVAAAPDKAYEEPASLLLQDGRIVLLLRENNSRRLHQTLSDDAGWTWSVPHPLDFEGYPAHLCQLENDRIVCTYGHRQPDYSIRIVWSDDGADHWSAPLTVRGRLPNKDLGYPCSVQRRDGGIFTVYYSQDEQGITGIYGSTFYL